LLALGFSVALASGCDVAPTDGASDVVEAPGTERVLGSLDVGYGTVSFHEVTLEDGSVLVGLSENLPAAFEKTPLQTLITEGHTSLEMWRAILPNQAAPDVLVQRQPLEAATLGRVNADLRVGKFDPSAQVPQSTTSCSNMANSFIFAKPAGDACHDYSWTSVRASGARSGVNQYGVINDSGGPTLNNVTMGVCNDSSVSIDARRLVKRGSDTAFYAPGSWQTVPPNGGGYRWYNFAIVSYSTCSGSCLSVPEPSYYKVETSSPTNKLYYQYTGVLKTTYKCL
jgi:hypothetical protein